MASKSDEIDASAQPHDGPLHFPAKDDLAHTKSMNEVIANAKSATNKEHHMTLLQGIKLYPKAVAWSLLISTCICMEGYDVCLLSNFCKYTSMNMVAKEYGKGGIMQPREKRTMLIVAKQMHSHNSTRSTERYDQMGHIRFQQDGKLVSVMYADHCQCLPNLTNSK